MALLERVDKLQEAIAWKGDIPISSRYTAGIAGERFTELRREAQSLNITVGSRNFQIEDYLPPFLSLAVHL